MAITNYGELKAAVQDWMDRTDQSTVRRIPDFIYLAEKEIMKTLEANVPQIPSLENEVEIEVYPFTDFVDMPADMGRIKYIYLPKEKKRLFLTTYQELLDLDPEEEGVPLFYARHIRRIYFRPKPPTTEIIDETLGVVDYESTKIRIVYVRDPVVFQSDSESSYFLTTCPEVMLYGALAYGYDFIKDPEAKQMAEMKFQQAMMSFLGQLKGEDMADTKVIAAPDDMDSYHSILYPYM